MTSNTLTESARLNQNTGYDMIYLAACALHNKAPDTERIRAMELPAVYHLAKFHTMQAITYMAFELWLAEGGNASEVIEPEIHQKWAEAKAKAIRKNILFETEREKLFTFMDEQNIWYMPLKGVILQDYYPVYGMRQMVDNDILFDSEYRDTIRRYFLSNGYKESEEPAEAHDVYQKPPVYNFEMHFFLYRFYRNHTRHEYYKNVKERLIPKMGNHLLEYRFTDEDFYIYFTAHAYKHFINAGIGIRSLMDVYVYLSAMEERLDWDYIETECEKLGMKEYEHSAKELAKKLFGESWFTVLTQSDRLTEREHSLIAYYINSGAHGTKDHYVLQEIRSIAGEGQALTSKSKAKYILRRIFPTREYIRHHYPFFDRHIYLLPVLILYRACSALLRYPKKLLAEFKLVWNSKQ